MKNTTTAILIFLVFQLFAQKPVPNLTRFQNPLKSKIGNGTSSPIVPTTNPTRKLNGSKVKSHSKSFLLKPNDSRGNQRIAPIKTNDGLTYLTNEFSLSDQFTFKLLNETEDQLGFSHSSFYQYYKGVLMNESMVLIHSKNDIVESINGQLETDLSIDVNHKISRLKALSTAKKEMGVTGEIKENPVELVITQVGEQFYLAYKVRVESLQPLKMYNVFVDAKSGEVVNKVSLIAHADEQATGDTYYSGNQTFTTDSFEGGYRLRDNARRIETYDATNSTVDNSNPYLFDNYSDFVNEDNSWEGVPYISSFTITNADQDWWYNFFSDNLPDFYIKLIDGGNQVVFVSEHLSNKSAPVSFDVNMYLNNPPYSIEIWDYDNLNEDDFGGSISISNDSGTISWADSGNSGSYENGATGHPAVDVHWGMQVTYDFYWNTFGRDSYDGNGSPIRQFVNPIILEKLNISGYPNNASAFPSPYNVMSYGMGDKVNYNPMVVLDVEGHEFTHMVVGNNGNGGLTYQGESGALNESFADIMGTSVEFYSGYEPDWLLGEGLKIGANSMRSLADPNIENQPDTYEGLGWINPENISYDHGGVHINSGVQNYWFYLLSEGGSGTNDVGNAFSVSPIGMDKAQQIAYRNLINYLPSNATYYDAYLGSLQSTEDLYGNPSSEYTAVKDAWYAVGIGVSGDLTCNGTTHLTASSGTLSDGSGTDNYSNNLNCSWVIAPPGAEQVALTFTEFETEAEYDTVFVYDGPYEDNDLLLVWWGNTLPPDVVSTSGAIKIRFSSDGSNTEGGWFANYTSIGTSTYCEGLSLFSESNGTFEDGSSTENYGNNHNCYWYIAPPCASTVTLSFSEFETEEGYDGVIIYDGLFSDSNELAVLTGNSPPDEIISNTGEMLVVFISDYSINYSGFTANYTSDGAVLCSSTNELIDTDFGVVSDGSGDDNYCNNQECTWLISPPDAESIILRFTKFDLELPEEDGKTIYDAVEIYDGDSESSTLLGTFTGNNIPPAIQSSGGSIFIKFYSDMFVNHDGWELEYQSINPSYCSGTNTLTAYSGLINDGSGVKNYGNNTNCSWLIDPPYAKSITISFNEFDLEQDHDWLIVFDGNDNTSSILGQYTGNSLPSSVTSTGGSIYIEFLTDETNRSSGWSAAYLADIIFEPKAFDWQINTSKQTEEKNLGLQFVGTNGFGYVWRGVFPIDGGSEFKFNGAQNFLELNPENVTYSDFTGGKISDFGTKWKVMESASGFYLFEIGTYDQGETWSVNYGSAIWMVQSGSSYQPLNYDNNLRSFSGEVILYDGDFYGFNVSNWSGFNFGENLNDLQINGSLFEAPVNDRYDVLLETNDGGLTYQATVQPKSIIVWDGANWSNRNGPTETDNVLIDGNYTLENDMSVQAVIINENQEMNVTSGNTLIVNSDLGVLGNLTIESGASLITFDENDFLGNITIKRSTRYSNGRYSFVGSPVEQSTAATGDILGSNVNKYNETTPFGSDGLLRWENALSDQLIPGKGYTQAFQKELVFSGKPNDGIIIYKGTYTQDEQDSYEGWNLVANPFPAAISFTEFMNDNNNNTGAIYIWDDHGSDQGRGSNSDYIVINASGSTDSNMGNLSRYNGSIGSSQGFFVQLDGSGNVNVVFEEDQRAIGNNEDDHFFRKNMSLQKVRVNLLSDDGLFKQTLIAWNDDVNDEKINRLFDAPVFNSKAEYSVFTIKNNSPLAIQTVTSSMKRIPIGINIETRGSYYLQFDLAEFDGELYLWDKEKSRITDIRNLSYSFISEEGGILDRFELITQESILETNAIDDRVYVYNNILNVNLSDPDRKVLIEVYSISGELVYKKEESHRSKVDLNHLNKGVYILNYLGIKLKFYLH